MYMSNIPRAFEDGKAFIAFLTGGDPRPDCTERFVLDMAEAGADLIEIGIPFSDPIAEGPAIQAANMRALASGTTVDRLFDVVGSVRRSTDVPIVFMTYLNPVFRYGYERFFRRCRDSGVDGIIIPDLPFEEKREVSCVSGRYGVDLISMVAPTSGKRIASIAREAEGFLYVVSSMGVTGVRRDIGTGVEAMVRMAREVTDVPITVGFGIGTPEQAREIGGLADGVIVGSAIVEILSEHGPDAGPVLRDYVRRMKDSLSR
jgi:tryptophan synthase alpha chain